MLQQVERGPVRIYTPGVARAMLRREAQRVALADRLRARWQESEREKRHAGMALRLALDIGASSAVSSGNPFISLFGASSVLQLVDATTQVVLNGSFVAAVLDQSQGGFHYSQPLSDLQPAYTSVDATLNNQPSVAHAATIGQCLDSSLNLPLAGTTPTTILAVMRWGALPASNARSFGSVTSGNGCFLSRTTSTSSRMSNATGVIGTALTIDKWYLVRAEFSNQTTDTYKIGSLAAVTGNAGNVAQGAGRRIGQGFGNVISFPENLTWNLLIYLNRLATAPELTAFKALVLARTPVVDA